MRQSNFLYFMVGVLAVAVGVLAYAYLADDVPGNPPEAVTETREFNLNLGDDSAEGSFEDEINREGTE